MSKFIDRLHEISQGTPVRLGFGATRRQRTPGMALIAQVSQDHAKGVSVVATLSPDAALISGIDGAQSVKEQSASLSGIPWGARVTSLSESEALAHHENGSDLLAFGLSNTSAVAVSSDEVARILCIDTGVDVDEEDLRTLGALPVDALLLNLTDHSGPWMLQDLARVGAVSRRVSKFILLEITEAPSAKELESLRDIGVNGLLLDVARVSADELAALKSALLDMPRPHANRRERSVALLPGSVFASPSQERHEEPDHDDDDDDE